MNFGLILFGFCLVQFSYSLPNAQSNLDDPLNGSGPVKKCAEFNKYCQTNLDCCSRNCLTFSYKCIRERADQPELPPKQEVDIPSIHPIGTVSNVQELVDRFGGDGEPGTPVWNGPPTNSPPTNLPPQSSNGFGQPPNPNNVFEPPVNPNNCLDRGRNCLRSYQCCSGQCSTITSMCITEPEHFPLWQPPQTARPPPPPEYGCSNLIGQKCYTREDCCAPLKCHDFYHHCVE